MTRTILHLGDSKTGSTALQQSLVTSREALGKAGIFYRPDATRRSHSALAFLAKGAGPKGTANVWRDDAHSLIAQTRRAMRDFRCALFSAEGFFPGNPERILSLLDAANPGAEATSAIVYLRRPDQKYISSVQQGLKASSQITPPHRYGLPLDRWLGNWANALGKENLTLREFSRRSLVEGDIVGDFAAWLGTTAGVAHLDLQPATANVSLSAEQMVVVQRYRRDFMPECDGQFRPEIKTLIRFFEALNAAAVMGSRPMLRDEIQRQILERHADMQARVARDYGFQFAFAEPASGTACAVGPVTQVSDLLQACDWAHVDRLCALLPDYMPALRSGLPDRTVHAIDDMIAHNGVDAARICQVLGVFWKKVGCKAAKDRLVNLDQGQGLPTSR